MVVDISDIILLIIYESFIIFSSIRITYFVTKKFQGKILTAELVVAWISIGLVLNFIISSIFSFLQYNGIMQYLLTSFLIVLILHIDKKSQLIIYKNYLAKTFNSIYTKMFDWKIIIIVSALVPLILFSMRPISDADSLVFLNRMFEYIFNASTPYSSAWNYVPVWELSYLPAMIVTSSDNFFWLNSFKPLIIIGIASYLIGREIKLPKYLILISIFSSILFFKIWITGAGNIGTLKNDYIIAAAVLLIIFSMIRSFRSDFDRLTYVFFSIGLVFLTIKFSGIALGFLAILVFIFINKNKILKNKKEITFWIFFIISFIFLTTGHYYLKNIVEYGNPFWPTTIEIMDYYLPGTREISSTSIYENLENEDVWKAFFSTSKISIGGLFFPVLVAFGFVGTLGVITVMAIRYLKTRKIEPAILVISFFIFVTWILYIITPFSAGQGGNLQFLVTSELASTRYIIGTLFLTELFFTFILWRLKVPKMIIFSFVAINTISRYWILLNNSGITRVVDPWFVLYPLVFLAGSFLFIKYSKKFLSKTVFIGVLFIMILILSPNIVEANREGWLPWWKNVVSYFSELPSAEIFLIREPDSSTGLIKVRTYPIYGSDFQHSINVGNIEELIDILSDETTTDTKPEYVVKLCHKAFDCSLNFREVESKLSEFNYETIIKPDKALLLKNVN